LNNIVTLKSGLRVKVIENGTIRMLKRVLKQNRENDRDDKSPHTRHSGRSRIVQKGTYIVGPHATSSICQCIRIYSYFRTRPSFWL